MPQFMLLVLCLFLGPKRHINRWLEIYQWSNDITNRHDETEIVKGSVPEWIISWQRRAKPLGRLLNKNIRLQIHSFQINTRLFAKTMYDKCKLCRTHKIKNVKDYANHMMIYSFVEIMTRNATFCGLYSLQSSLTGITRWWLAIRVKLSTAWSA